MGHLVPDTIKKFNDFIDEQRGVPGEARVTVVLFDNEYEILHKSIPLVELPELTGKEYFARGSTNLNDAVGKTINEVGGRLNKLADEDKPEKVIFVVITDGMENTSQEFPGEEGRKKVKAMVDHQTEKYGWGFLFLGANMDAVAVGASFGVQVNMCATYGNTSKGLSSAYQASGQRVAGMRCMPSEKYSSMHALDEDTEK